MGNCVGGGKGWLMEVIIFFSNPTPGGQEVHK